MIDMVILKQGEDGLWCVVFTNSVDEELLWQGGLSHHQAIVVCAQLQDSIYRILQRVLDTKAYRV
jgi:hypothetical protein